MDHLLEFVTVAEAGSVSEAARRLDLPRATVSRRVSALERRLGVTLLHRSTRHLRLTRQGRELLGRGRRILDELQAAEAAMRGEPEPSGRLSLALPRLARPRFAPLLAAFLREHPRVRLDVVGPDQPADLVVGDTGDPLGAVHLLLVAAPAYVTVHGAPRRLGELRRHACLGGPWPLAGGGEHHPRRRLSGPPQVLLDAARAGLGLALAARSAVATDLDQGRLLQVLAGTVGRELPLFLHYPAPRLREPALRALVEHLV